MIDYDLIPEGKYETVIVNVTARHGEDNQGKWFQSVTITCRVVVGEHKGRDLSLTRSSKRLPGIIDKNCITDDLIGVLLILTVIHEEEKDGEIIMTFSKVTDYKVHPIVDTSETAL